MRIRQIGAALTAAVMLLGSVVFPGQRGHAVSVGQLQSLKNIVSSVEASSEYKGDKASHSPENLIDGSKKTNWTEDADGPGIGEYVYFRFKDEYRIDAITIHAGNHASKNYYKYNFRPEEISLEFSDGSVEYFLLEDVMQAQTLELEEPVWTDSVKLTIESVFGEHVKWEDTCISEVSFKAYDYAYKTTLEKAVAEAAESDRYWSAAMYDLDGNGVDELIIQYAKPAEDGKTAVGFRLYTLEKGKPKLVKERKVGTVNELGGLVLGILEKKGKTYLLTEKVQFSDDDSEFAIKESYYLYSFNGTTLKQTMKGSCLSKDDTFTAKLGKKTYDRDGYYAYWESYEFLCFFGNGVSILFDTMPTTCHELSMDLETMLNDME